MCVCMCRIVAERFRSESKILSFSQMKRPRQEKGGDVTHVAQMFK